MLSVIIPNWNGAPHLPTCLAALRQQTFRDFEILVVDNASHDESLALLARDYPEVRVIALDRNYGFAGACNAGLRAGQGQGLVLLNNDTEAAPASSTGGTFCTPPAMSSRSMARRAIAGCGRPTRASLPKGRSFRPMAAAPLTAAPCSTKSGCWMKISFSRAKM